MKAVKKAIFPFILGAFVSFSICFMGNAMAEGDAALYGLMQSMFSWMQDSMMTTLHKYLNEGTNKLKNQMMDNFKEAVKFEKWPAGLESQFSKNFYEYRFQASQSINNHAKDYLSYTQGSASGHNAGTKPAAIIQDMNVKYKEVQSQNPNCELVNPQNVGTNDDKCTEKQLAYTNYLLSGVAPMPVYPDTLLQSPTGQQYELERKQEMTRLQLANKAVEGATNNELGMMLQEATKYLSSISKESINAESPAAVARDTLLTLQTIGVLIEKGVESQIETQRLLGVLVAQNQEAHQAYLRALQKNMMN